MPPFSPPEAFNIADYFLDDRLREGRGDRTALRTDARDWSYAEVAERANRVGHLLREAGVQPEQRVLLALPDGADFVAGLFGALKLGAAVVMANPGLRPEEARYFLDYTRAVAALVDPEAAPAFEAAAGDARHLRALFRAGEPEFERALDSAPAELETFPTHREDAAIWLFSGGTTGRPKAVVQTHASYANSTECYAKGVLRLSEEDVTLSVPKLFFGYATGSNLLFPFAVGGTAVLFPERCTTETLFEKIRTFRPTLLVNVPTMVGRMVEHPEAAERDLSCLRLATSAGEALPPELHRRWDETFGVELLDGLGTAEMWHIFLSNRPGEVRPGTLGKVVSGFEVRVRDEEGRDLPDGEVGWLWVRGGSRALGYWQRMEKTCRAFRGEWYVSGDLVSRDAEGWFTYAGRADDMLKVSGKWLSPREVEDCLLRHPAVREVAVVGVTDEKGLVKPRAVVVCQPDAGGAVGSGGEPLAEQLQAFVRERLAPYKYPREVVFVEELPRTHLGKVDRGRLRDAAPAG